MSFDFHNHIMMEDISSTPWTSKKAPERILAIRLQAIGDVVITLPYLQSLKDNLPGAHIDFLTRKEAGDIPQNLDLFARVFSIGGGRSFKWQVFCSLFLLPLLWARRYEVVIDLQRNTLSRWIRKLLRPRCWSEFDRFSPRSAGERNRSTIEALGLGAVDFAARVNLRDNTLGLKILEAAGWNPVCDLVVLNPAGGFPTKNWPLGNYVAFAKLWLTEQSPQTQFLVLGVESISQRAQFLKAQLGDNLINLVNRTSASEALAIVQKARLVVSEDSGLMHMAWISGIPTVALFGSSRSDWSAPLGEHSICLNSADLPCGECMAAICQFGDVRCLTRYTPQMVFTVVSALLEKSKKSREIG